MKSRASYSIALAAWGFVAGSLAVLAVLWILGTPVDQLFTAEPASAGQTSEPGYYEYTPRDRSTIMQQVSADIVQDRSNAIINSINNVSPSVVSISLIIERRMLSRGYRYYMDPFYNRGEGKTVRQKIPKVGTGFLVNPDGMIVTNHHVIEHGKDIMVSLQDGREFDAEILGKDEALDLALLKIEGEDFPYAPLGDSDNLVTGEWAIAIGNPFGNLLQDNQPTVTVGVISAVRRKFISGEEDERYYQNMIQTDAAINPGNSGGPLVNAEGEVIGINTFIFTPSGGNIGLGFARPINEVKRLIDEILTYGEVRDVYLGFYAQTISSVLARSYNLPSSSGFIIVSVDKGSPAWEAGLRRGDVVYALDDVPIKGAGDSNARISSLKVGDELKLRVYRDGRYSDVVLEAVER
jgi:serine protease Do